MRKAKLWVSLTETFNRYNLPSMGSRIESSIKINKNKLR